ncbi:MAG TPA: 30S ribosomal protein S16 [Thermomicrobiales bacterium]|nr:30S ribosomal protein S16 [Thermomicrobiales bacterium]
MLKLRLRRMGAKRQPSYRIVVAESRSPRDGRFIETVGIYNPKTQPMTLRVDSERAKYWLERGAQPTDTVRSLLVRVGAVPGRISKEGLAEGYVTEVPSRGSTPEVMQAHGGTPEAAAATAAPAKKAKAATATAEPAAEVAAEAPAAVEEPAAEVAEETEETAEPETQA